SSPRRVAVPVLVKDGKSLSELPDSLEGHPVGPPPQQIHHSHAHAQSQLIPPGNPYNSHHHHSHAHHQHAVKSEY
ncbi:Hypothetical protein FKW44_017575, partial [Caligus rogercresseyi]